MAVPLCWLIQCKNIFAAITILWTFEKKTVLMVFAFSQFQFPLISLTPNYMANAIATQCDSGAIQGNVCEYSRREIKQYPQLSRFYFLVMGPKQILYILGILWHHNFISPSTILHPSHNLDIQLVRLRSDYRRRKSYVVFSSGTTSAELVDNIGLWIYLGKGDSQIPSNLFSKNRERVFIALSLLVKKRIFCEERSMSFPSFVIHFFVNGITDVQHFDSFLS